MPSLAAMAISFLISSMYVMLTLSGPSGLTPGHITPRRIRLNPIEESSFASSATQLKFVLKLVAVGSHGGSLYLRRHVSVSERRAVISLCWWTGRAYGARLAHTTLIPRNSRSLPALSM